MSTESAPKLMPSPALFARRNSAERQCTRYRADESRCPNSTTSSDGWCRKDGCPGFVSARPVADSDWKPVRPYGTKAHMAATADRPVDLGIDEVDDVRISQRARDSFRYHHRGSDETAEAQLRWMLEDFLIQSARDVKDDYTTLSRSGYALILSPDLTVVVGYKTVHAERTWEQVKAGVPSRFGAYRNTRTGPAVPPAQEYLPIDEVLAAVDPSAIVITAQALNSYDRAFRCKEFDDETLDFMVRSYLQQVLQGPVEVTERNERIIDVRSERLTWLIRRDGLVLMGVKKHSSRRPTISQDETNAVMVDQDLTEQS